MTNNISHLPPETSPCIPLGAKLRAAREARNIERKEAAQQLRLKEEVIEKLEKDAIPDDMHVTFLRGYIRLYGKFLDLSEKEIQQALEPIQPKPLFTPEELAITKKHTRAIDSNSPIVRLFTFAFIALMVSLVALRWYNHNSAIESHDTLMIDSPADLAAPTLPTHSVTIQPPLAPPPSLVIQPNHPGASLPVTTGIKPPFAATATPPAKPADQNTMGAPAEKKEISHDNIPEYAKKDRPQISAVTKKTVSTPVIPLALKHIPLALKQIKIENRTDRV